ncbi:MAG: preprotein translocase subunit SecE [Aerococcus sp.]|nr:preprotein translocase subunit SecE [Aerococcus sp.]
MGKIFGELKNITWPTGKQLRRDTGVVIMTIIIFAIFLGVVDELVTLAFRWYLAL